MSVTRHGDFCLNGPDQFPGCDQQQKDTLWQAVTSAFDGLLVNHSLGSLNETTLQQLINRGQRVVVYAGDYSVLTRDSPLALDACLINNVCLQDVTDVQQSANAIMSFMKGLRALRADSKLNNTFVLLSLADAAPNDMIKLNALILYEPLHLQREQHLLACASLFKFPNSSAWCPRNLTDISLTAAYYNQVYLDAAFARGYALPNAIYTDAVGDAGTLLTSADGWVEGGGNKFAYAATLLLSTVQQLCNGSGSTCQAAVEWLTALRSSFPVTLVEQPDTGRYASWPLI